MKITYKHVIIVQAIYATIALLVALVIWGVLGEYDNRVEGSLPDGWRVGGPIGGWVLVWLLLSRQHVIEKLAEAAGVSVKADILLSPTQAKEYSLLFENFNECDYVAFNAPFQVEEAGDRLYDKALAIHQQRYQTDKVRSRYLFYNRDSFTRAVKFFKKLKDRMGAEDVEKSVKLRMSGGSEPGYAYFVGEKDGIPTCVIYPAARFRGGLPDAVICFENASNLVAMLARDFNERWRDAETGENWP